jgi:hypothetical protein
VALRDTNGNEKPAGGEGAANEWERRGRFFRGAVAGFARFRAATVKERLRGGSMLGNAVIGYAPIAGRVTSRNRSLTVTAQWGAANEP